jgi:DNA replication and repair protein RecF
VFSELDPQRAAALVEHLPVGQTLVTTASTVPSGVRPERRVRVADGRIEDEP